MLNENCMVKNYTKDTDYDAPEEENNDYNKYKGALNYNIDDG